MHTLSVSLSHLIHLLNLCVYRLLTLLLPLIQLTSFNDIENSTLFTQWVETFVKNYYIPISVFERLRWTKSIDHLIIEWFPLSIILNAEAHQISKDRANEAMCACARARSFKCVPKRVNIFEYEVKMACEYVSESNDEENVQFMAWDQYQMHACCEPETQKLKANMTKKMMEKLNSPNDKSRVSEWGEDMIEIVDLTTNENRIHMNILKRVRINDRPTEWMNE